MKKDAIGHMTAPKQSTAKKIKRWDILPRLFCLLLALLLWILLTDVNAAVGSIPGDSVPTDITEQQ